MIWVTEKKEAVLKVLSYLVFLLALIVFTLSPLGRHLNTVALDSLRTKDSTHDAVILAIDDTTLQKLGAWPLNRTLYAQLIEILQGYGVKGLVFDVLFLEEKSEDEAIKKALSQATYQVVFGSKQTDSGVLHPVFQLGTHVGEGLVNVSPNYDGKVRDFALPVKVNKADKGCLLPLSLTLFVATQERDPCVDTTGQRFVYPKSVPTFSLSDVLEGKIPKELFKDKVLFVGATTLDLEDYFVGLDGSKVPGVVVHAAMYSSYLNSLSTVPIAKSSYFLLMLILVLLGHLLVWHVRQPGKQLLLLVSLFLTLAIGTIFAYDASKELPLVSLLVSLFGSFIFSMLLHYANSRKENALIKTMFSRYVNKEVLRELLHNPYGKRKAQKQYVTILFSDLRGFTDFSETLEPEELTGLLNTYFSKMVTEIFKESGTVDKFIGDAVMAFWNAPLVIHNHEYHAVCSAIRMQEALITFNQEQGTHFKMGIGVHAGFAIIGNVGGSERMSYTALGDSVNTASRLEAITKTYDVGIIISEEVAEVYGEMATDSQWRLRRLDEVRLKGKQKSTVLFEVTKLSADTVTTYEKALSLYQKSNFAEALTLLDASELHRDGPSLLLKKRMESGLIKGGWDGVWVFEEK